MSKIGGQMADKIRYDSLRHDQTMWQKNL